MASKLQGLKVLQTPYKQIDNRQIRTDVLVPETPTPVPGKRPVIVRFHGGGLVMGDSLYMPFYPQWLTDLALAHNAVILSPNYRLLPEATTAQIFQDVSDFWTYIHSPALASLLSSQCPPVEVDVSRVLVAGDSAGGLLSISTALTHSPDVRAAIATYPLVDPVGPEFVTPRRHPPFGQSVPESVYNDTLASAAGGKPAESSLTSPERLDFMLAATQHGRLGGLYKRGLDGATPAERRRYFPLEALEAADVGVPKGGVTILQGTRDSVVPVESVRRFVKRAREVVGDGVRLAEKDGEHGFDSALRYDGWLKDELKTAVDSWLE